MAIPAAPLLLVEDESLLAVVLSDELDAAHYAVRVCSSGTEALNELTTKAHFAALITDIRLGEGPDGWQVARFARTKFPKIPVIYITGDSAIQHASLGMPGSTVLEKPFHPIRLVEKISRLLRQPELTVETATEADGLRIGHAMAGSKYTRGGLSGGRRDASDL